MNDVCDDDNGGVGVFGKDEGGGGGDAGITKCCLCVDVLFCIDGAL